MIDIESIKKLSDILKEEDNKFTPTSSYVFFSRKTIEEGEREGIIYTKNGKKYFGNAEVITNEPIEYDSK